MEGKDEMASQSAGWSEYNIGTVRITVCIPLTFSWKVSLVIDVLSFSGYKFDEVAS